MNNIFSGVAMRAFAIGAMLFFAGGCAAQSDIQATPPGPPPLAPPSNFQIGVSGEFDLTPPMTLESGLPSTIKLKLLVDAHSEAISASPMQSRNEGHLVLLMTDGNRTFANVQTDVSGISSGTPDEGLIFSVSRFVDAASLVGRATSQLDHSTHSTGSP
jgi:hypothetical protein